MAVDMFIKLSNDIKGESQDKTHADEIDVLAWSWGMSNSGTMHAGGGGGAGKANFQDISITKWIDKASPVLMQFSAKGTHIDEATLTVRKAGDVPLEYLVITFKEILVSSVSTGGSGGEDRLTENVSLNFRKFTVKYQEQAQKGGAEGGKVEFGWDIAKQDTV
jgi:type VI secretion system secreted protein Hcp